MVVSDLASAISAASLGEEVAVGKHKQKIFLISSKSRERKITGFDSLKSHW